MEEICHVCGEPLDDVDRAHCNWCGEPFHFAMSITSQTQDCGRVWIDEELLALTFICQSCDAARQ